MHEGLILCRFVHFGAVLLLFGIGLFRSLLFKSHLRGFECSAQSLRIDRSLQWLSIIALMSALAWLMLTAASMAGDWLYAGDLHTLALVLDNTFFGHVWLVHLALNGVAVLLLLKRNSSACALTLGVNTLLLLTLAPVGHGAMFDGLQGLLLILNQMVHLLGVGTWLGALVMLAVLLAQPQSVDVRAILLCFSGMGYALVALIVISGLVNVRALSGGLWPEPAFSGFGGVLALKVLSVMGMLMLAGLNRFMARRVVLPLGVLRVSVALECLFGAAALAAVSLLGTLPPMLVN
jgi:putative copper resistance protein D